jgi:integrase/recombinase XerD
MTVTLRKRENKDSTTTLYLDIYHNGKRRFEFLKHCKQIKPTNPSDRVANKQKLQLANQIRDKRSIELQANEEGIVANHNNKVELKAYFENYIANYTKKDKRNIEGVYNKFLEFAKEQKIVVGTLKQLTESIVQDFADYLKDKCKGEGANSYFARFKKVLNRAVKDKIITQSPAFDVTIKRDVTLKKDVLTIDEIQLLANTDVSYKEIRVAFLFSCFTGLRWVDIKNLRWKHIDLRNKILTMVQSKTDEIVSVTLNVTALALLPTKAENNDLVFQLPSHTMATKALKNWVEKAELGKHITWHCARHSFGTNLVSQNVNLLTISKLMGHKNPKYTNLYTRVANDLKAQATDSLPTINI